MLRRCDRYRRFLLRAGCSELPVEVMDLSSPGNVSRGLAWPDNHFAGTTNSATRSPLTKTDGGDDGAESSGLTERRVRM